MNPEEVIKEIKGLIGELKKEETGRFIPGTNIIDDPSTTRYGQIAEKIATIAREQESKGVSICDLHALEEYMRDEVYYVTSFKGEYQKERPKLKNKSSNELKSLMNTATEGIQRAFVGYI